METTITPIFEMLAAETGPPCHRLFRQSGISQITSDSATNANPLKGAPRASHPLVDVPTGRPPLPPNVSPVLTRVPTRDAPRTSRGVVLAYENGILCEPDREMERLLLRARARCAADGGETKQPNFTLTADQVKVLHDLTAKLGDDPTRILAPPTASLRLSHAKSDHLKPDLDDDTVRPQAGDDADVAPVVHHQGPTFTSIAPAAPPVERAPPPGIPEVATRKTFDFPDIFRREVLLEQMDISTKDNGWVLNTFDVMDAISPSTVKDPPYTANMHAAFVKNFVYYRPDVVFRLVLGSARNVAGMIRMLHVPPGSINAWRSIPDSYNKFWTPRGIELNYGGDENSIALEIPFSSIYDSLPVPTRDRDRDHLDNGAVILANMASLETPNGAGSIGLSVYVSFKHPDLRIPAPMRDLFEAQGGRPGGSSPGEDSEQLVSGVGALARIATRFAMDFVPSALLDNPADFTRDATTQRPAIGSLAHGEGVYGHVHLSLGQYHDTPVKNYSDMSVLGFAQRKGVVVHCQPDWSSTTHAPIVLPVNPSIAPLGDIRTDGPFAGMVTPTPMGYAANAYCMWSGSINYDIHVIVPAGTGGSVGVTWFPMPPTEVDWKTTMREIAQQYPSVSWDLSTGKRISVNVRMEGTTRAKYVPEVSMCIKKGLLVHSDATTNGVLVVYAINQISIPLHESPKVKVLITASAGDDFELAVPALPSGTFDSGFTEVSAQGGSDIWDGVSPHRETIVGENHMDFRSVLARKSLFCMVSENNPDRQMDVVIPISPIPHQSIPRVPKTHPSWVKVEARGSKTFSPAVITVTPSAIDYDDTTVRALASTKESASNDTSIGLTPLVYFGSCFASWSGTIHVSLISTSARHQGLAQYQLDPLPMGQVTIFADRYAQPTNFGFRGHLATVVESRDARAGNDLALPFQSITGRKYTDPNLGMHANAGALRVRLLKDAASQHYTHFYHGAGNDFAYHDFVSTRPIYPTRFTARVGGQPVECMHRVVAIRSAGFDPVGAFSVATSSGAFGHRNVFRMNEDAANETDSGPPLAAFQAWHTTVRSSATTAHTTTRPVPSKAGFRPSAARARATGQPTSAASSSPPTDVKTQASPRVKADDSDPVRAQGSEESDDNDAEHPFLEGMKFTAGAVMGLALAGCVLDTIGQVPFARYARNISDWLSGSRTPSPHGTLVPITVEDWRQADSLGMVAGSALHVFFIHNGTFHKSFCQSYPTTRGPIYIFVAQVEFGGVPRREVTGAGPSPAHAIQMAAGIVLAEEGKEFTPWDAIYEELDETRVRRLLVATSAQAEPAQIGTAEEVSGRSPDASVNGDAEQVDEALDVAVPAVVAPSEPQAGPVENAPPPVPATDGSPVPAVGEDEVRATVERRQHRGGPEAPRRGSAGSVSLARSIAPSTVCDDDAFVARMEAVHERRRASVEARRGGTAQEAVAASLEARVADARAVAAAQAQRRVVSESDETAARAAATLANLVACEHLAQESARIGRDDLREEVDKYLELIKDGAVQPQALIEFRSDKLGRLLCGLAVAGALSWATFHMYRRVRGTLGAVHQAAEEVSETAQSFRLVVDQVMGIVQTALSPHVRALVSLDSAVALALFVSSVATAERFIQYGTALAQFLHSVGVLLPACSNLLAILAGASDERVVAQGSEGSVLSILSDLFYRGHGIPAAVALLTIMAEDPSNGISPQGTTSHPISSLAADLAEKLRVAGRAASGAMAIVTLFRACFPMLSAVATYCGAPQAVEDPVIREARDWIEKTREFAEPHVRDLLAYDPLLQERMLQHARTGGQLDEAIVKSYMNSNALRVWSYWQKVAKDLAKVAYRGRGTRPFRIAPFMIVLHGVPGTGKSSVLNSIMGHVQRIDDCKSSVNQAYYRTGGTHFWDGYGGQHTICYDDEPTRTDPDAIAEAYDSIIGIKNAVPRILPMADLADKGIGCDARLILQTSNAAFIDLSTIMADPGAVHRRRDITAICTLAPPRPEVEGYDVERHRFQITSGDGRNRSDQLLNLHELLCLISKEYKDHTYKEYLRLVRSGVAPDLITESLGKRMRAHIQQRVARDNPDMRTYLDILDVDPWEELEQMAPELVVPQAGSDDDAEPLIAPMELDIDTVPLRDIEELIRIYRTGAISRLAPPGNDVSPAVRDLHTRITRMTGPYHENINAVYTRVQWSRGFDTYLCDPVAMMANQMHRVRDRILSDPQRSLPLLLAMVAVPTSLLIAYCYSRDRRPRFDEDVEANHTPESRRTRGRYHHLDDDDPPMAPQSDPTQNAKRKRKRGHRQYRGRKRVYHYHPQSNPDDDLRRFVGTYLQHHYVRVSIDLTIKKTDGTCTVASTSTHGLGSCGNNVYLPGHTASLIGQAISGTVSLRTYTPNSQGRLTPTTIAYNIEDIEVYVADTDLHFQEDIGCIHIPGADLKGFRDIRRMLATEERVDEWDRVDGKLVRFEEGVPKVQDTTMTREPACDTFYPPHTDVAGRFGPGDAWSYPIKTRQGDCGSLVLIYTKGIGYRIAGFHVAGGKGRGYAAVFTQEKEADMQTDHSLDDDCEEPEMRAEATFVIHSETMDSKGDAIVVPKLSLKSKLRPTPFLHSPAVPHDKAPAALSNDDPRIVVPCGNLVEKNILKYDTHPPTRFSAEELMAVRNVIGARWRAMADVLPISIRVRSYGETLTASDTTGVDPVDPNKSAGYKFRVINYTRKTAMHDYAAGIVGPVERGFHSIMRHCERGKAPSHTVMSVLKDEKVTLNKIREGRTRIFDVLEVDFNLVLRALTMDLLGLLKDNFRHHSYSVGINPFSADWDWLYKELASVDGGRVSEADYSNFDGSVPPEIILTLADTITDAYQDGRYTLRRAAFEGLCKRLHLVNRTFVEIRYGNPSGCSITTLLNCFCNEAVHMITYARVHPEYPVESACHQFLSRYKVFYYGDDVIAATKEPQEEMALMVQEARQLGFKITDSTKSGPPVKISIMDASYLKCHFAWIDELGRYSGKLSLQSIVAMLDYVRAGTSELGVAHANATAASLFLLAHPTSTYDLIENAFNEAYAGVLTFPSREEALEEWRRYGYNSLSIEIFF